MRRFFIIPAMAVFLSACVPSSQNTGTLPTFLPSLTTTPALNQSTTSAIVPTETSKSALSPTSVPTNLIIADFPLSVGTIWKYSGEISFNAPQDNSNIVTWTGMITDSIIEQVTNPDGSLIFTNQEILEPTPPEGVWRQSGIYKYIVTGDGIFVNGIKLYQWPLSDNLRWESIFGTGYDMEAHYIGEVHTPYGNLQGCYTFLLATLPDTTVKTFCPVIGFVEHQYQHNGDRQDEHFILVSYESSQ